MADTAATTTTDATTDAPWGINPATGRPYRRDPGPFAHLRRNGNGAKGSKGPTGPKGPAKRSSSSSSSSSSARTAAHYAGRIGGWLRAVARWAGRRNQVDGAIVAIQAPRIAEAWGQVAIDYPRVGAFLDRLGPGGALSEAVAMTLVTAGMVAVNHGLLAGTPVEPILVGALHDLLMDAGLAAPAPAPDSAPA